MHLHRHFNRFSPASKRIYLSSKFLGQCFSNINTRCNNSKAKTYKDYGGKGIKNKLTYGELWVLWERDKGWMLKQPSIDRIDSNGNYEFDNCRFIEKNENLRLGREAYSRKRAEAKRILAELNI